MWQTWSIAAVPQTRDAIVPLLLVSAASVGHVQMFILSVLYFRDNNIFVLALLPGNSVWRDWGGSSDPPCPAGHVTRPLIGWLGCKPRSDWRRDHYLSEWGYQQPPNTHLQQQHNHHPSDTTFFIRYKQNQNIVRLFVGIYTFNLIISPLFCLS